MHQMFSLYFQRHKSYSLTTAELFNKALQALLSITIAHASKISFTYYVFPHSHSTQGTYY